MVLFLDIPGAICTLYFFFLLAEGGLRDGYRIVWLLLALFFFGMGRLQKQYNKKAKSVPLWILVSGYTLFTVGFFAFIWISVLIAASVRRGVDGGMDYLILTDAQFYRRKPSFATKKRLNQVIAYLQEYPQTSIVLSGKGEYDIASGAERMADYLLHGGVDPAYLLLEIQAKNTRESLIYSNALIVRIVNERRREFSESLPVEAGPVYIAEDVKPLRVGILTEDFSAYRIKCLLQKRRNTQWRVYTCAGDPLLYPHKLVKEVILVLKSKFMGYF